MVETLEDCIKRYRRLRRFLKNRDPPDSLYNITEAKPKVVPIDRGDTENIKLWVQYMKLWHPKGFTGSMGRSIKFFVIDEMTGEHLGALSIGTPVFALSPRDRFIGWTKEQRIEKVNKHIANNWRFLIFSYVNVKNLGSQILSQLHKVAKNEWKKRYGDRLVLLETFVDENECNGAGVIYKAAGWYELIEHKGEIITHIDAKKMGLKNPVPARTKGYSFVIRRGTKFGDKLRGAPAMPRINTRKKIFLKPLHRYWRKTLCGSV
jgi:hypothetical protein